MLQYKDKYLINPELICAISKAEGEVTRKVEALDKEIKEARYIVAFLMMGNTPVQWVFESEAERDWAYDGVMKELTIERIDNYK